MKLGQDGVKAIAAPLRLSAEGGSMATGGWLAAGPDEEE